MEDITKQNFMYCLRAKEGNGCLCAAMFYIYKDGDNLLIRFKSGTDKYAEKTRANWKTPFAGEEEMTGFYEVHKETISFLEKNFPDANWWPQGQTFDDENRIVTIPDWEGRNAPDGMSEDFWKQELHITEQMFSKGYLNGNYPQGHYSMNGNQMVLVASYFGAYTGTKLNPLFVKSLNSCHKLSDSNLKKNWLVKEIVKNPSEMNNIISDDFWRLSLASQLYNSTEYKDNYIRSFLELLGPSSHTKYQDYITACLEKDYADYELSNDLDSIGLWQP